MALFDTIRMGASAAGAYEIERSLRFNSVDSANLTYTPASPGNLQKFTFSFWIKKNSGIAGGSQSPFSAYAAASGYGTDRITIMASGSIQIEFNGSKGEWRTTRLLRDTGAWYHIVVGIDSTQGAVADRMKLYVNGEGPITDFDVNSGSNFTQNHSLTGWNNSSKIQQIGSYAYQNTATGSSYYDGNITEFYLIDDQQLTPESFGETDVDTGQWIPKKYSGTYNSNCYFLNFSDNSNTTAATLGKDSSGNSNNWTCNNFSVAAGKDDDSSIDTPTNNFPTLNDNDRSLVGTISNGGLRVSYNYKPASKTWRATMALPATGKFYWEWENEETSGNPGRWNTGLVRYTAEAGIVDHQGYNDVDYVSCSYGGSVWAGTTNVTDPGNGWSSWPTFYSGERMAYAVDMSNGKFWLGKVASNGSTTWYAADSGTDGNPAAGTNEMGTLPNNGTGQWVPYVGWHDGGAAVTATFTSNINFGQHSFLGTKPTGFDTLCSANLPDGTIKKGTDYFNTITYTGNNYNGTRAITGLDFNPDLVWSKATTQASAAQIYDSVRGYGADKELRPDETQIEGAEDTAQYGYMTALDNGFNLVTGSAGAGNGNAALNVNAQTYATWCWKEASAAGFDIVGYTGNASGPRNISHGLNVKPEMMIFKNREAVTNWMSYHHSIGATKFLYLNTTANQMDDAAAWNDTEPTSSVFTVNADEQNNGNNHDIIAYLWTSVEGFSRIGSYTGNGDANGTFVYLGFKPAWLIMKRIGTTESWVMADNKRNEYNVVDKYLLADTSGSQASGVAYDFVSNGVKFRGTSQNESGVLYLYMAFAECPFKYAIAR